MKGVILAGGKGTRLRPMTDVVNKHVLPIYDRPMIFYPVQTLLDGGIDDIMVVSTPADIGRYIQLLEEHFEASFSYRVQKEPAGIAHALYLAAEFVDETVAVILGDNVILSDLSASFTAFVGTEAESKVYLKAVHEPSAYGVAEIQDGKITALQEKPEDPTSNYAVTGLYLYTSDVFDVIAGLEPSDRGEYEITDVNATYLERGALDHEFVKGEWFDVGTPEGMFRASEYVREQTGTVSQI